MIQSIHSLVRPLSCQDTRRSLSLVSLLLAFAQGRIPMLQQLFGTGAYLASPSPILTPNEAHLVALSLTSAYVGGLYVSRLALLHNHRLRSIKHVTSSSSSSISRSDIKGKQDTPLEDLVESDSTADLDRDDPRVIKSRIRAVGIATLGGCATVGGLVYCRANHQDLGSAVSVFTRSGRACVRSRSEPFVSSFIF